MKFKNDSIIDDNYKKFIEIINEVIPLEMEKNYNELVNKLKQYIFLEEDLKRSDYEIFYLNRNIFEKDKEKQNFKIKNYELFEKKNAHMSGLHFLEERKIDYPFELWMNYRDVLTKKIDENNDLIKNAEKDIIEFSNIKNKLQTIFLNNKNKLDKLSHEIIKLLNNENNINEIRIKLKNIVRIRELDLNKNELIKLEKYFILYIKIKLQLYKKFSSLAASIKEKQDNNNLFLNLNKKDETDYKISILSFDNINLEEDNLKAIINFPGFDIKLRLMEILNDYFDNKEINLDEIYNIINSIIITPETKWMENLVLLLENNNINNKNSNKMK